MSRRLIPSKDARSLFGDDPPPELSAPAPPVPAPAVSAAKAEQLTSQQRAAIEARDVSVALSAGAGCGKTFVLTRRFLSHLEPGPEALELSQIVAITFTERAAREMRDRVRKECRRRLDRCPPDQVDAWQTIVRELDSARISTIHSFCGTLLRTNAVEAGLDPLFKLLDESTGGSLLRNAVSAGIQSLLARRDPDVIEVVLELGLGRTATLLESLVTERYRLDIAAWRNRRPEEVAALWENKWRTEAVPQILRDLAASPVVKRALALLSENVPDQEVMLDRRGTLLDELPKLGETADPFATLNQIRAAARIQGGGTKDAWRDEQVYADVRGALEDLREVIDKTLDQIDYEPDDVITAADLSLRMLRVAEQVGQHYDERKRLGGWLDFDDLLLKARDLLRDHPEVLKRAASGIELLLVDEFQDTDPIQTEIVRSLCGNELLSGKLFVVGDVKQSIYRFRRAEPQVFRDLRQEIPERGRLPLTTNFRSQPAILNFVNALFDGALGSEYEALSASCGQISAEPTIEFLFATPDVGEIVAADDSDESATARRQREAQWIARRLRQLLDDGVPRVRKRDSATGQDALRVLEPRDVVILFRAMTDVRHYEAALRDHGLDYYVVGGQAFFAQQEVFDLVNLCRVLDDPDDEVALVGLLRSPFFSLSDDALLALARERDAEDEGRGNRGLLAALDLPPAPYLSEHQQGRVRFAGEVLHELRTAKDRLSLAELLTRAVDRTGYDASLLTEFLGARKLANLRKLIDLARRTDQSGLMTLSDFVARLQESVVEEVKEPLAATHPESSNVIRLMSIHQSKGLEFPLVVIADMDRKGNDLPPSAKFDPTVGPLVAVPEKFGRKRQNLGLKLLRWMEQPESMAETLRLLYVAATRAADHLILSANLVEPGKVTHPWLRLVRERFDLSTGQPRLMPTDEGLSVLAKYASVLPQILVHHHEPDEPAKREHDAHKHLPLREVRIAVESAQPRSLPPMLVPLPVDRAARLRFSVSEIRQADADLKGHEPISVDASDDRSAEEGLPADDLATASDVNVDRTDARELGDIVHVILERIRPGDARDPAMLVDEIGLAWPRVIGANLRTAAAACLETYRVSPVAHEIATARRLHREVEFYLPWPVGDGPPRIITGKLDCLLETADGRWAIVDYKTGKIPKGRGSADVFAEYEMQLAIYALAVERLIGRRPDRAELLLLREGGQRLSFAPESADWPVLHARVDGALRSLLGLK